MSRSRAIAALASGLMLLIGCAATDTADPVLDQAEEALGGAEALAGITSLRIRTEGSWTSPAMGMPPMPYRGELVVELPDRIRRTIMPAMGEPMLMGFDGENAWGQWMAPPARYTGYMRDMVVDGLAEMKATLVAPARGEAGSRFTLVPSEGETTAHEVTYAPASGGTWDLWFDAATGHLVRGVHAAMGMDGRPLEGHWERSEPVAFGDITFPSKLRWEGMRDGEAVQIMEETIVEIEWNPELEPGLFAVPEPGIDVAEIGIKTVPPMTVVTVLHEGSFRNLDETIARLISGLMDIGLMPMGAVCGTYHHNPNEVEPDEMRTDVSAPVMIMGPPPELPEGFTLQQWPATKVAYAYHVGDPREEGEAHERLFAWVAQNGRQPVGPPRGMWLHNPEVTVTEDLLTEVQVPVR